MGTVTISASYGAGGSVLAPRIAERLGLPFLDRAISVALAAELGISPDAPEAKGESPGGWWARLANVSAMSFYADPSLAAIHPPEQLVRERSEQRLREIAEGSGGVILGRAAAMVLADVPNTLHVRLDGPVEARIEAAMRQHGISREEAKQNRKINDEARTRYVRQAYRVDPTAAEHYHLVINTGVLSWDTAEELIMVAAADRGIVPAG
ncbi:MAG TPA: cytidylate kinase-like family protein [Microlunatus sp.]|nr:cytidylate kinase-like family protein [Microlunatus sp.]